VSAILLGMARLDAFDTNAEAKPPDGEFVEVEQSVRGSEGHTVITANVGGQGALAKKPFKYGKSILLPSRGKRLTGEQRTAGVVGDRERVAVVLVAEQELAFVVGAPEFIGSLPQ